MSQFPVPVGIEAMNPPDTAPVHALSQDFHPTLCSIGFRPARVFARAFLNTLNTNSGAYRV